MRRHRGVAEEHGFRMEQVSGKVLHSPLLTEPLVVQGFMIVNTRCVVAEVYNTLRPLTSGDTPF